MEREQIEDMIKRGVAEAKAEIAEGRNKYLILIGTIMIGVFGILVPLWFTHVNTSEIDAAIVAMNSKFDKLAQRRQPDIQCSANGRPINNAIIALDAKTHEIALELENAGNGTAYYVETFLYLDSKDSIFATCSGAGLYLRPISDDAGFSKQFEYTSGSWNFVGKRKWPLKFKIDIFHSSQSTIRAKLKVFSVEAGPWEFPFTISETK